MKSLHIPDTDMFTVYYEKYAKERSLELANHIKFAIDDE